MSHWNSGKLSDRDRRNRTFPLTLNSDTNVRNVSFKYPDAADYALRNVSFSLLPGQLCVRL